jgi:hypothetical protein
MLALEPVSIREVAGAVQGVEGRLGERREPQGVLPELVDLLPEIGWLLSVPISQDRPYRLSVLLGGPRTDLR